MHVTNRVGVAMLIGCSALLPVSASAEEPADPCAVPTIVGTDADDHIIGTEGVDVIDALSGDHVVEGLGGDDLMCGGDGGDSLIGGAGNDRLYGQAHVIVTGMEAVLEWRPDILNGGAGDDYLNGGGFDGGAHDGGDYITFEDAPQGVTVDLDSGLATGDGTDTIARFSDVVWPDTQRWNIVGSPYADTMKGDENRILSWAAKATTSSLLRTAPISSVTVSPITGMGQS